MNTLYGLIVKDFIISDTDFYKKLYSPILCTQKVETLKKLLTADIAKEDICRFASIICYESRFTIFGPEIYTRDSNNTYVPVIFNPADTYGENKNTLKTLAYPIITYNKALQYLDNDIKNELVTPTWFDTVAAISLQMLREVV